MDMLNHHRLSKYFTFTLIGLVLLIASCSKDDDVGLSSTEMLTAGRWYIKALDVDPAYSVDIGGITFKVHDLYFLFDNCATDNYLIFNSDSTLISDTGTTKCDSDEPQTVYGTWQLDSTESKISWSIPSENINEEYGIAEISSKTLKLVDIFEENGVVYHGVLTLKH
jgi:hypothetical protein